MKKIDPSIFKAYDIRGIVPDQLDEQTAYLIGRAYAQIVRPEPKMVGLGRDVRSSGESLWNAMAVGLIEEGLEVVDLGVISTDMLYFGVAHYELGGGLTVSASHNPAEYNGVKLVRQEAIPISGDTGIMDIRDRVMQLNEAGESYDNREPGHVHRKEYLIEDYLDKIFEMFDLKNLQPITIAVNANHGKVGDVFKRAIEKFNLPIAFEGLWMEPNGDFPQGRPDPLQEDNQRAFAELIRKGEYDFGVAWDADADRCFFFDEKGAYIHGYYTTAVLAKNVLNKEPGAKIISDPRLVWAVKDTVEKAGGEFLVNKVGHSFIKERMRKEGAAFAGENSGHYYYRDFYQADNGFIPFLQIWEMYTKSGQKFSEMFAYFEETYPHSGEINTRIEGDVDAVIDRVQKAYKDGVQEPVDGLSVEFNDWRFNLRKSNTEPLLRLNLEAKNRALVEGKTKEVLGLIGR